MICIVKAHHVVSFKVTILPFQPLSNHSGVLNLTKEELSQLTIDFTHYHLHFYRPGKLEEVMCNAADRDNMTLRLFEQVGGGGRCLNDRYRPRTLRRTQISWKPSKPKAKPTNSSSLDPSKPSNATVDAASEREQQEKEREERERDRQSKVHTHLIFALLLPSHPPSQTLQQVLGAVAPMYPQAVMVKGDAYEFREMVARYAVSSLPRLLLFKEGIFSGDYQDALDAPSLAAYLAVWMDTLP
ncbi:hypothetical protein EON64_08530, partial [archaeon]